jgi:hypothetical protein
MQQVGDERLERNGVAQDGEDVEEDDSLRGESAGICLGAERVSDYQETRRAHLFGEVGVDAEERLEVCDVGHGAAKLFKRELLAKDK